MATAIGPEPLTIGVSTARQVPQDLGSQLAEAARMLNPAKKYNYWQ